MNYILFYQQPQYRAGAGLGNQRPSTPSQQSQQQFDDNNSFGLF